MLSIVDPLYPTALLATNRAYEISNLLVAGTDRRPVPLLVCRTIVSPANRSRFPRFSRHQSAVYLISLPGRSHSRRLLGSRRDESLGRQPTDRRGAPRSVFFPFRRTAILICRLSSLHVNFLYLRSRGPRGKGRSSGGVPPGKCLYRVTISGALVKLEGWKENGAGPSVRLCRMEKKRSEA